MPSISNLRERLTLRYGERLGDVSLILANAGTSVLLLGAILLLGEPQPSVAVLDSVFEAAAAVVAFGLFVAAALLRGFLSAPFLLLGLWIFQLGRSFDFLDELVRFPTVYWSVLGDLFTLVGELLVALAGVRWVAEASQLMNTDPLTRLGNRRHHERRLAELLRQAGRERSPLAVIAVDLDHFKSVNDRYGHGVGDVVLQHVAGVLVEASREGDVVSRVGGEEFEVLLPSSDAETAAAVAERIRSRLEATPPPGLPVLTASLGVALGVDEDSPASVRDRADRAVYAAKAAGRNCVRIAPPPAPRARPRAARAH